MAKSLFTYFRSWAAAAAAAEPKIKDNILHHLSLIEREGNLFDLWLCFLLHFPFSLPLPLLVLLLPIPVASASAAAAVLIFSNPAHLLELLERAHNLSTGTRTRTCSACPVFLLVFPLIFPASCRLLPISSSPSLSLSLSTSLLLIVCCCCFIIKHFPQVSSLVDIIARSLVLIICTFCIVVTAAQQGDPYHTPESSLLGSSV